jgi:RNA polymerase sigma-70 factor (ECF subfamily)
MSDANGGQANFVERTRQEGAQPAGSSLFRVFLQEQNHLRRVAAGMGMAGADIDDVLQDVSVQVFKQLDPFENKGVMARWLIKTTVNRCLTEHRRRFCRKAPRILRRRPDLEQALTAGTPDATNQAAATEELEIIRRTMAELDPSLLELVVLRYFCDLDSNEIGRTLDLNPSTVRCRLREARMILARKLVQRGVEP